MSVFLLLALFSMNKDFVCELYRELFFFTSDASNVFGDRDPPCPVGWGAYSTPHTLWLGWVKGEEGSEGQEGKESKGRQGR